MGGAQGEICWKMRFTYTYRSSDGQRHTAEVEAESRDAAFAKVRAEMGVKPIKVTAEGESGAGRAANVSAAPRGVWRWVALAAAAVLFAAVLGGAAWRMRRPNREPQAADGGSPAADHGQPITVATPQGPVTLRVAEPLPRQMIPGDRKRLGEAMNGLTAHSSNATGGAFRFAAEAWLARFAEPGRTTGGKPPARPSAAEFAACLKEPIRIASTDFTEVVDLKRIVTGMKREMRAYIAGGGTVEGYLAELEKRQKLEVSYRERAEQKLTEMISAANGQVTRPTGGDLNGQSARPAGDDGRDKRDPPAGDALRAAYAYWLKANAQLQAMGIHPLALPDALRSYQMSLDIDE